MISEWYKQPESRSFWGGFLYAYTLFFANFAASPIVMTGFDMSECGWQSDLLLHALSHVNVIEIDSYEVTD